MRKKISAIILATVVTGSLYAEDISVGEKILGLEIGASKIQADNPYSPIIGEYDHESDTTVSYGLRMGAQKTDWRTLLVVDYFDSTDDDQEYLKGFLEVDYFLIQDSALKPYIGLNVGYMSYQTTDIDDNGFLYGGQVGVSYRVAEHFEADIMYRYSLSDLDSVDHIEGIMLGLSYIF